MQTVKPITLRTSQHNPNTWAKAIMEFLLDNFTTEERLKELQPIIDLASDMLSHLLVASRPLHPLVDSEITQCKARNPGGKKTPQESVPSTPNVTQLRSIQELSDEAIMKRSQSALKELVC